MDGLIVADTELHPGPELRARVGGKGAGLVELRATGSEVPRFAVVSTAAWSPTGEVSRELRAAIAATLERLGDVKLAVRSSAVAEDSAAASWAGQFETVLGVRGLDAVVEAVRTCWASAHSERVQAYASRVGVDVGRVAVVIQEMVEGEASGVLFSRDPANPDTVLISAGLGLGEGVVQGRVPCDTWRVGRNGTIEAELADKDERMVLGSDGPEVQVVDGPERHDACLADEVVRRLAAAGMELESALGYPVDVEFTVRGGEPVLLQVRAIAAPVPMGRRLLWDNSNIVESYSGITTPLTFSFASRAYTIVYQLFCRVMGVAEVDIRENEPTFRRMIGLVRGRIYYNLNAWYRVLSLLPGFSFNRSAMETMMGVSEVASDEDAGAQDAGRFVEGMRLARLMARLGWRLLRLEKDAAAFQVTFDAALSRYRGVDFGRKRADELLVIYEDLERELLWGWTPPLVNDFFCMIFYSVLAKRCAALTGDPDTQLHNALLAGEGSLASAAPALELVELARDARGDTSLVEDLEVEALEAHPAFRARFEQWLDRYGDRSPDELKLEAPTLKDTPGYVLGMISAMARRDELPSPGAEDSVLRRDAEAKVAELLRGPIQKATFRYVLRQARRRVAMRESLRFERTRIFGLVRDLFRAFGDRYVEAGALDTRDDVFWLTVDEVLGFTRGTAPSTDLRALAAVRAAEFERYRADAAPAERFHTWGAVHVANRFQGRPQPAAETAEGELLGTPCCPGVVVAPARVVTDPRQITDLAGGILVAHRTDPGWVPLFPTASAVLVERGSLLSHSAVVARELGLPAVVGVRGLLEWVEDGELLGLDGSTGRVWREGGDDGDR